MLSPHGGDLDARLRLQTTRCRYAKTMRVCLDSVNNDESLALIREGLLWAIGEEPLVILGSPRLELALVGRPVGRLVVVVPHVLEV
jgi:hypothetical protein